MRRTTASAFKFVPALALVLAVAAQPGLVAAAPAPGSAGAATGALADARGEIVLPSGKVLPPPPAGAMGPSEMAQALEEHAHDRLAFTPGAMPRPRAASGDPTGTGSLTLADSSAGSQATLIPLAPTDGSAAAATLASLPNGLKKQVFGFLPYWTLARPTDMQWMRYDLVSTIAYFGVAARSDGSLNTSCPTYCGWTSSALTGVINAAHARGDRVVLTITMMAWDSASANAQATLLTNATYRTRLVNNIVAQVKARNADGANLDFEPLASSLRTSYTAFVRQLKAALSAAGSRYSYLTVCTMAGAATWATGYDVTGLTAPGAADGLFVMGYDYSWSGSSRAGGVAPMTSSYMLDVNESATDYLSMASGSKLIWGVPYYGRTWHTTTSALNASTVPGATSAAPTYVGARSQAAAHGRHWDSLGQVPWFVYYDSTAGNYVEGYYDDPVSLGVKYDMINRRGMAGVGIWALMMDAGVSDLWNLIANKFQTDKVPPSGGISNMPPVTDAYGTRVTWRAIDVGSGLASYTVQVRDWTNSYFSPWLTGVNGTAATYVGLPGHAYEFRVSARDKLGNTQPWVAAMTSPGTSLVVGAFASVAVDQLNVRSGAGTTFTSLAQLAAGSRVALLSGPLWSGGYAWYQVQYGFTEWPSAEYPRTGWAAAGNGSDAYLVPAVPPTVTRLSPHIAAYSVPARAFSPNGDGVADSVSVTYSLSAAAVSARLDALNASGTVVASMLMGAQASGTHAATWDGHTSAGGWAPPGSYVLRLTVTDAAGAHVAPMASVDPSVLSRWGVTADLTAPTLTAVAPIGTSVPTSSAVSVTFSEPVSGVAGSSFALVDWATRAVVPATVSYNVATRVATLKPSAALAAAHTYRAWLGSAVHDLAGNALASTSWPFTTASGQVTIYSPARAIHVSAGSTTGYKFDSTGKVIASKTASLATASSALASQRSKVIPGHPGAWFSIVNGVWAGYWVAESTRTYLPGIAEQVTYSPAHTVSFLAGTYTGYRFTSSWTVSGSKSYTLARASSASTSTWAVINGRGYAYILNGVWAGYWVPTGGGVTIR